MWVRLEGPVYVHTGPVPPPHFSGPVPEIPDVLPYRRTPRTHRHGPSVGRKGGSRVRGGAGVVSRFVGLSVGPAEGLPTPYHLRPQLPYASKDREALWISSTCGSSKGTGPSYSLTPKVKRLETAEHSHPRLPAGTLLHCSGPLQHPLPPPPLCPPLVNPTSPEKSQNFPQTPHLNSHETRTCERHHGDRPAPLTETGPRGRTLQESQTESRSAVVPPRPGAPMVRPCTCSGSGVRLRRTQNVSATELRTPVLEGLQRGTGDRHGPCLRDLGRLSTPPAPRVPCPRSLCASRPPQSASPERDSAGLDHQGDLR